MAITSRVLPLSYNTKTYGDGARQYTSLDTWEQATDIDLVSAGKGEVLECYDDAASFDDSVILYGATVSSDYFRVIKPATGEGHDGTKNNGVTFAPTAPVGVYDDAFTLYEAYASIQDLIVIVETSADRAIMLEANLTSAIGCITTGYIGIYSYNFVGTVYSINCLSQDCPWGFYAAASSSILYCLNCTAVDGSYGFYRATPTLYCINCCSCDNSLGDFYLAEQTTCYGGDDTVFANQAGDDYHLHADDTTCRNQGTNLSGIFADRKIMNIEGDAKVIGITLPTIIMGVKAIGEGLSIYNFDDDIDAETRSAWDIGFDEYS